jgi:hypothetical protein
MNAIYLPQEVIDRIISHTADRETLASLRLVSRSCRSRATSLYFRQLFIMLSSKSVANIDNPIQSPYSSSVEELHWADVTVQEHERGQMRLGQNDCLQGEKEIRKEISDLSYLHNIHKVRLFTKYEKSLDHSLTADKELQYQLNDDLEAFQDTFKERSAGLSSETVLKWHERYRALYSDQENLYYPLYVGAEKRKFNVESFVNLKRVSVNNGCEVGAEQYPTAFEAQENLEHPARWSTTRQCRPERGAVYVMILKSLATLNRLTHLSVKTEGAKWERIFMHSHPLLNGARLVSMFENIRHLDVDLCLWWPHSYEHIPTPRCRLSNLGEARNLKSLTWKTHLHAVDEAGSLGRPLSELHKVDWLRPPFTLRSELYPGLRYLELHCVFISDRRLLKCLTTLQSSLQSLILRHCIFKPCLSEVFMEIREKKVVPPVAIFEHSQDHVSQPVPEKPTIYTENAITQYLVWLGMKESLCLHSWDERIEAYAIQLAGRPLPNPQPQDCLWLAE